VYSYFAIQLSGNSFLEDGGRDADVQHSTEVIYGSESEI
jgi:hypothetical protein